MRELWKAFVARLVYLLTPKPPVPPPAPIVQVQAPESPLTHGVCICTHSRNCHRDGKGVCAVALKNPDEKHDYYWGQCACQIFIPKKDDPPDPQPETPSPSELEELFKK